MLNKIFYKSNSSFNTMTFFYGGLNLLDGKGCMGYKEVYG